MLATERKINICCIVDRTDEQEKETEGETMRDSNYKEQNRVDAGWWVGDRIDG